MKMLREISQLTYLISTAMSGELLICVHRAFLYHITRNKMGAIRPMSSNHKLLGLTSFSGYGCFVEFTEVRVLLHWLCM